MNKLAYLHNKVFNKDWKHLYSDINFFLEINKYSNLKNKKILEIGCGNGNFLILCSLFGKSKYCYGLDPALGMGSDKNILEVFKKNTQSLNLKNVKPIKADFLTHNFREEKYDVIIAINSVHHIIETDKNLLLDKEMGEIFLNFFKKIFDLLNSPGIFVLYDISKYNIKRYCNLIRKITKSGKINYRTKHSAKEYSKILKKIDFKKVIIKYYMRSYYLNNFKFIFSNPIVSFFTDSAYFIFSIKN